MWVPETLARLFESAVGPVGSAVVAGRSVRVAVSLRDWSLRRLPELLVLRRRSEAEKEIEILCFATNSGCSKAKSVVCD